ncbi:MAG TPA: ABC transporter permease [Nocardioides sp.]|uniref:ABC transporter permease n=1 Tax=Nocardioides sp. TaxID=35761 RepID=UPI002BCCA8D9|nr:ABC transporter permease [Nocardioides sp.]HQR25915.1 ABC transporter permease [Nocardioides sp.]
MSELSATWLVALREMRERSRTRAFQLGVGVMLLVVVAMIAVPGLLDGQDEARRVGVTGSTPSPLAGILAAQGDAAGVPVVVREFPTTASGEEALRGEDLDVLLVDGRRLEWRGNPDEELQAAVAAAVQIVAIQERAAAAGLDPETVRELLGPVPVENVRIGVVAGRSVDDEVAALVMSTILMMTIFIYGSLVLTGVAEEKSSRVIEVLLARVPVRSLLVGKVLGIGLLGFAQLLVTALAALATSLAVDSLELPSVSGGVLVWVVVWFVLGYALYAMVYGAFGSLASRSEDAQSIAGPVGYVLIAAFWASFLAISGNPDGVWSQVLSFFPATAPMTMPSRLALGAATSWESLLAACLTLAALAALVAAAGRVYGNAVLHLGATLGLREAWKGPRHGG